MLVQTVMFFKGEEILPRLFLWGKHMLQELELFVLCIVFITISVFSARYRTITDVASLLEMLFDNHVVYDMWYEFLTMVNAAM
jgi:hypothetical protein